MTGLLYVCMYVCVYVCLCMCVYIHCLQCVRAVYVCMCVCMFVYVCIYPLFAVREDSAFVNYWFTVCMYVCMYVCVCVYIHCLQCVRAVHL
jgi:hypothetical protein